MCQHDSEQTGQLLADTCYYVYVYINVNSGLGTQKLQAFQAAWERPHRIPMVQKHVRVTSIGLEVFMIGSALDLTAEVSCANLSYQHWLFQTSESAQRFSGIPFVESKPPSTSKNLKAAVQYDYMGTKSGMTLSSCFSH